MMVLFSCSDSTDDSCSFSGNVISLVTQQPVPNAKLTLELEKREQCGFFGCNDITRTYVATTRSDADGNFSFDVPECNEVAISFQSPVHLEYIITGLQSAEYYSYQYFGNLKDGPIEVEALNYDVVYFRHKDGTPLNRKIVRYMFYLDGERYLSFFHSTLFETKQHLPRGIDFTYDYVFTDASGTEQWVRDVQLPASANRNKQFIDFE